MHNFATEAAKRRPGYQGEFASFTPGEIDAVPNWIAIVNMVLSLIALGLLVAAIFIRLT